MKSEHYEMIIWWSDEDQSFVVDVPQLSGCLAHGSTRQRAIRNAEEAIQLWLATARKEGGKIPPPRGRPGMCFHSPGHGRLKASVTP
ncbi:MAG TPA: type II toxin-antitoxin system HicB family antitoxin [Candidatus Saccharimonadales bacterium]|nr:type II toxin-antitoxin system HicB family antitoxin [Candidatus Saccharimonadales bacterium]